MWLSDYVTVGTLVERADNPRHRGRVLAVFGTAETSGAPLVTAATFRVRWDCGWKEDCTRNEISRRTA